MIRKLFPYTKGYRHWIILGILCTAGEAVLELLQAGDGSLAALDVPELEPLDGLVMVSEVAAAIDLEAFDDDDAAGPFQPEPADRLVGRLDEHPFLDDDDEDEDAPA